VKTFHCGIKTNMTSTCYIVCMVIALGPALTTGQCTSFECDDIIDRTYLPVSNIVDNIVSRWEVDQLKLQTQLVSDELCKFQVTVCMLFAMPHATCNKHAAAAAAAAAADDDDDDVM